MFLWRTTSRLNDIYNSQGGTGGGAFTVKSSRWPRGNREGKVMLYTGVDRSYQEHTHSEKKPPQHGGTQRHGRT